MLVIDSRLRRVYQKDDVAGAPFTGLLAVRLEPILHREPENNVSQLLFAKSICTSSDAQEPARPPRSLPGRRPTAADDDTR